MAAARVVAAVVALAAAMALTSAPVEAMSCTPCENCAYTGTATLTVLGTHNHETITVKFNETAALWVSGAGDTSHTVSFPMCGPIAYHRGVSSRGTCELVLDAASWASSVCARHHHLTSKMRNLRMTYDKPEAVSGTTDAIR